MKRILPLISLLILTACGGGDGPSRSDDAASRETGDTKETEDNRTSPEAGQDTGQAGSAGRDAGETASVADCGPVSQAGYCGVRFGMSEQDAQTSFPGGLTAMTGDLDDPAGEACYYLNTGEDEYDIGFMVEGGIVVRLDVRAPDPLTVRGAGVGMGLDAVMSLYPDAVQQPNKYAPDQPDIVVTYPNGNKAVFETDEAGAVSRYRIGQPPQVDYVEGCS